MNIRLGISTTYWNHGIYCGYSLGKLHGMMEWWNFGRLGMKHGKRSILQKMLNLHFLMMLTSHIFSVLPYKILH